MRYKDKMSHKNHVNIIKMDDRKRQDRNIRLLKKLEDIEKKAAFLQAKTDRIRSLKSIYRNHFEKQQNAPTYSCNNLYNSYLPVSEISSSNRHYFHKEQYGHNLDNNIIPQYQQTVIKNITLEEAIEEISKRFVLIPKNQTKYNKKPDNPPNEVQENNLQPYKSHQNNDYIENKPINTINELNKFDKYENVSHKESITTDSNFDSDLEQINTNRASESEIDKIVDDEKCSENAPTLNNSDNDNHLHNENINNPIDEAKKQIDINTIISTTNTIEEEIINNDDIITNETMNEKVDDDVEKIEYEQPIAAIEQINVTEESHIDVQEKIELQIENVHKDDIVADDNYVQDQYEYETGDQEYETNQNYQQDYEYNNEDDLNNIHEQNKVDDIIITEQSIENIPQNDNNYEEVHNTQDVTELQNYSEQNVDEIDQNYTEEYTENKQETDGNQYDPNYVQNNEEYEQSENYDNYNYGEYTGEQNQYDPQYEQNFQYENQADPAYQQYNNTNIEQYEDNYENNNNTNLPIQSEDNVNNYNYEAEQNVQQEYQDYQGEQNQYEQGMESQQIEGLYDQQYGENPEYNETLTNQDTAEIYNQNEGEVSEDCNNLNEHIYQDQTDDTKPVKPLQILESDTEQFSNKDETSVQESDFDFSVKQ